jgi:Mycotoxin biosynthesis protein UstYa
MQIMCQADVGLVPFVWVAQRPWYENRTEIPHRLPNFFYTAHKCRDFDSIREWYLQQQTSAPYEHADWVPQTGDTVWNT